MRWGAALCLCAGARTAVVRRSARRAAQPPTHTQPTRNCPPAHQRLPPAATSTRTHARTRTHTHAHARTHARTRPPFPRRGMEEHTAALREIDDLRTQLQVATNHYRNRYHSDPLAHFDTATAWGFLQPAIPKTARSRGKHKAKTKAPPPPPPIFKRVCIHCTCGVSHVRRVKFSLAATTPHANANPFS